LTVKPVNTSDIFANSTKKCVFLSKS